MLVRIRSIRSLYYLQATLEVLSAGFELLASRQMERKTIAV